MPTVNAYPDFSKMLKSAAKNGDVEIADQLITHMLPFLSEEDQEDVRKDVFDEVMVKGTLPIKRLFIQHFGLLPNAAYEYIKNCLENPEKERDLLQECAKSVQQYYGVLQAGAVIMGDLEIAEVLLAHKPDRAVEIDRSDTMEFTILLDGEKCLLRSEIMQEISGPTLKRLFTILDAAGLRDVFDNKRPLFSENIFKDSRHSTKSECFKGELPKISAGVMANPELFLAFLEESGKCAFGKVYNKIPCWVKDEEHENNPLLMKFKNNQVITRYKLEGIKLGQTLSSGDLEAISEGNIGVTLGLICDDHEIYDTEIRTQANALVMEMLPLGVQAGLVAPTGFKLAIVDLEYLKQYTISQAATQQLEMARKYTDSFFSASALFNAYDTRTNGMSDGEIGIKSHNGSELFDELAKGDITERLLNFIPDPVWKNLFRCCSYSLNAPSLIKAKSQFGLSNLDARLSLSLDTVNQLHAAGYRFEDNGHNCSLSADLSERDANPKVVIKFIQMGGWPSNLPRPADVEEALGQAMRQRNDPSYVLYLQAHGAEESLKVAKTPSQFKKLFELFTSTEITPHLKLVPRNLRGKHLENELGL
jgi:hypothetical protein